MRVVSFLSIFFLISCKVAGPVKEQIGSKTPTQLVDSFTSNPAGLKPAPTPQFRNSPKIDEIDYETDAIEEEEEEEEYTVEDQKADCIPELESPSKKAEDLESDSAQIVDDIISNGSCKFFSKFKDQGVPEKPLQQALAFLQKNPKKFKNKKYISIGDFSQHSGKKRYYLLNMLTGEVEKHRVSHGSGKIEGVPYGDRDHDGMIDQCKLTPEQLNKVNTARKRKGKNPTHNRWAMTRAGFFSTAYEANSQKHDPLRKKKGSWPMFSTSPRKNKLLLKGLTPKVNDKAIEHGVVMHEAWYNTNDNRMGRSFGCPAFQPNVGRKISKKIKGGALYYSYVPKCKDDMDIVEKQVPKWQNTCKKTVKRAGGKVKLKVDSSE